MSSGDRTRAPTGVAPSPVFSLRLGLWYATLFITGSIAVVFLTYLLLATSLADRDREIINQKLGEYASVYSRGGLDDLTATVRAEQETAPERLFVRVVDRGSEALVLSNLGGVDQAELETGSLQLADGTLVEVGKSIEARRDLLARFRATMGFVTLLIVVIALTGGWLAMQTALQPIRRLTLAFGRIIRTGRTDERVPLSAHDDAIDQLTALFNAMLDKIEGLVTGMRDALNNVSHDLRTPLTRLRGSAEMALAAPDDLDRCREALADCIEETDHVLVMLDTLMDISEAESGTMPLQREPIALATVATRAIDLYRDVADAKGVRLTAEVTGDTVVSGDRVRLEQVAANLLDNAVKYTNAGGHVAVTVTRGPRMARLEVRDTGRGIPSDELPHIWDRLFRGDTSRAERGLGLGLSLVKAIVEAHGGTVGVESAPGSGSIFVVDLPLPDVA